MYNKNDSLTSWHKITLAGCLIVKINQSLNQKYLIGFILFIKFDGIQSIFFASKNW